VVADESRVGFGSAGGRVSDETKRGQKYEFFVVLVIIYLVGIGTSVYVHLQR
jgi:hypothetical protein